MHGHARATELRVAQAQGVASVVEHDGPITGCTTGVGFFRHASGETAEDVNSLIAAAPAFAGRWFLVPTCNVALFEWCRRRPSEIGA